MKNSIMACIYLVLATAGAAQTGAISGRLIDSSSKKPLPFATVTVFRAKDTSIVTYRLSDPEGVFKVGGLPMQVPLRVIISFSGYRSWRASFTLGETVPNAVFDTVRMAATTQSLDEVTVIAERPPVSVKHDTIEFNATAFKTLPNALLEDLLKKLPGVYVDADGNISVNGKAVNRILVDGKTFFGSDPKMATRNLPANIIDKVQVADDKEELARNGDDNLNNIGKVVNITLKKGVKKGWFGKVYAGAGGDERYEAGGIANIFRDTLQVSLLGYVNNLNKPGFGFSDLMQTAGLERTNTNLSSRSVSVWTNGAASGISVNGINFGGLQNGEGIATSRGAGINLNHAPNAKKSLFAQYFYGNVLVDKHNLTDIVQFSSDTSVDNRTGLDGSVLTNAHNIGIGGKFKPDSVTTILVNANYIIGLQDELRFNDISSINNISGPLSSGAINQDNRTNTYNYRHGITYTRQSPTKKGRRYTVVHSLDVNNHFNNYYTNSLIHYINPTPYDSLLNQLRREDVPRTDLVNSFNYSDPLTKKMTLRLGGRYEYGKLTNGITTFNPDSAGQGYSKINPLLSSIFNRENHRVFLSSGFEFKVGKNLTVTPGARFLYQKVINTLVALPKSIRQQETNILPQLSLAYKQLNFNYNMDIALPAYSYLLPVADNSNPYIISRGNPDLLPAERHNFSISYFQRDQRRNLSVAVNASGGIVHNDVIQNIIVDARGIQTNYPVNANGSSNAGINYNINKQYKSNPRFIVWCNLGAWYGYNRSRLLYNGQSSFQTTFNLNQWGSVNLNFNDKFEWNNNFGFAYNATDYTTTTFRKITVLNDWVGSEMILRVPKHFIWESNFNFNHYGNIPAGLPKDIIRWNLALNITMLKDEKGVLRFSVMDVLGQNANINVFASGNRVTTTQTNVLGRYFLATFTYNIRTVGGAKRKVGGDRLLLF